MSVRSSSARLPSASLELFSRNLSLSAGSFFIHEGERVTGPMRPGLKVAVMLEGRQALELDDRPAVVLDGPAVLVAANGGDHVQQRTGLADGELRYALMQFDFDFVAREFGEAVAKAARQACAGDAGFWVRPADAPVRALALQMADCPVGEALRPLYLAGKALELGALVLDRMLGERPPRPARLNPRLREQVHTVRDLLLEAVQEPPSLAELARLSGLNPTKLTAAFRAEFGTSVFEYLQEHRLQQAYAMIASGEANVAVAAFRVGYSPAHFSGLFRKRFGIAPSALR
ncbi:helix-turn-helix transcriptional regulator [Bosea sp. NBC_00550]|uniref:helix-turn-helix transcriptional regulator n=1 Tax=Bosea sp. NBC_00550 TaxID=2969621 RepID=UPI0022302AC9|nr:AraC family transcriptional regulator [Bosea sp. NBC_00550]UZF91418.1 AraC family transcriptional regulator [Bosea sp. NBC_00550]